MRERWFVDRRADDWARLDANLTALERGRLRAVDPSIVAETALLYRAATADLALARSRGYAPETVAALNRLVARAHGVVYANEQTSTGSRLRAFVTTTFPREVRRSAPAILSCTAIFIVAALIAAVAIALDVRNFSAFFPASALPTANKCQHDTNFALSATSAPAVSSQIITNNILVAILAFAGGITAGVLTAWSIWRNGLMLGGYAALFSRTHCGYDFWATIAPHGVIELTAIQIAGGAGLLIAAAIVAPGRLRRIDALTINARRAGVLVAGVALMLVVAGLIEGFISPRRWPPETRLAIGAVTALALAWYFARTPRDVSDRRTSPASSS